MPWREDRLRADNLSGAYFLNPRKLRIEQFRRAAIAGVSAGLIVFGASFLTGWLVYNKSINALKQEVRENLIRIAGSAASVVDVDLHKTFSKPETQARKEYQQALEPLGKILRSQEDIRFVYTCVLKDGKVFFVLDPTPAGDSDKDGVEDKSNVMDEYSDPSPALIRALKSGRRDADEEPYSDEWGTYISGYAPFFDKNDNLVGVVGVDLSAKHYLSRLAGVQASAKLGLLVAFLMSFAIGIGVFFGKSIAIKAKREKDIYNDAIQTQKTVLEMVATGGDCRTVLTQICDGISKLEDGVAIVVAQDNEFIVNAAARILHPLLESRIVIDEVSPLIAVFYDALAVNLRPKTETESPEFMKLLAGLDTESVWCEPIVSSNGEVLGVLMAAQAKNRSRSAFELTQLNAGAQLAEIAISRFRNMQSLAHARDEAIRALQFKSSFLANMSHELRTPMTGIIGMTKFLLESDLKDEQRENAETISASANSLLTVINDILDASKLEAGKMTIEKAPFNLRNTIEDVVELVSASSNNNEIDVLCRIQPDFDGHILGDSTRISQIVTNLMGNAIKFTKSGHVLVDVSSERVSSEIEILTIAVEDTGIGIPAERIDAIFETFTQVDTSTTRRFGGTGLGLSICKQLAEMMGGSIRVTSQEGKGSRFVLTVPVEISHEGSKDGWMNPNALSGNRAVVFKSIGTGASILSEQLEFWGCEVTCISEFDKTMFGQDFDFAFVASDHIPTTEPIRTKAKLFRLSKQGVNDPFPAQPKTTIAKPITTSRLYRAIFSENQRRESKEDLTVRYSGRVLVAEDNPINQKIAKRILEKIGFEVTIAGDGKEAVEFSLKNGFDLILMDIQMPRMDGIEATRAIRRDSTHQTPIVAMTANTSDDDRRVCLEAGMDDFLTKPIDSGALQSVLEKWLRKAA